MPAGQWFVGAAFSPDSLAGLAVWYKADSLALSDTDPVATWADSSVNARNATQGTAGNRPLYRTNQVNGKPAVLFDGIDDYMTSSLPMDTEPRTFFAIVSMTANGNYAHVLGPSANFGQAWFTDNVTRKMWFGQENGGGMGSTALTALTIGTFAQIEFTYEAIGNYVYYLNKTADGSGTTDVAWTSTTMTLGAAPAGGFPWPGYIAELLVYDALLSATDRQSVENYLATKYGL